MFELRCFDRNSVFIYNDPLIVGDVILQRAVAVGSYPFSSPGF